ncbi:MAG TPA: class I SAM-dependent methyltransferase [Pyrinomonadaceae bacterium]|nr:class I SAM-dependent methyltransferase [Pyrinomonadaceae bacterium]
MRRTVGESASQYFGSMAESYDSLIRRGVPRYDEMLERLVDYLPRAANTVLELGCGTGNLSLALAARYPSARITFVDASPEMIEVTRARLNAARRGEDARFRFACERFESFEAGAGEFDLVASSISLHHVVDKGSLYARVRSLVADAGTFRFSDQLRGETEEIHALNWERWLDFCRGEGNCDEEEVAGLLAHAAAHDHYTPLSEQFQLLRAAGFRRLDCVWRNWIWGIIIADV